VPRLPNLDELRERHLVAGKPLSARAAALLRDDPRAGAQNLLRALDRRRAKARAETLRLTRLTRFERELREQGYARIAGVDEAGMSPLAGPVVAAAVILPEGYRRDGIDDSKKLSAAQREELRAHILADAVAWGVGIVEPDEIDRINIYRAGLLAMSRAVLALDPVPDYLLIDARSLRELPQPQRGIVQGDAKSLSIAAASIVAKTTRDARMCELDARFPGYGFARHKGYPVAEHVAALGRLGACPVHRRSFAPVQQALGLLPDQLSLGLPPAPGSVRASEA
jgi:ribonuclease HII